MNGKWDKNNEILAITWLFSKGLNRFSHDPTHIYTDGLVLFIDSVIWSIKFLELFQRILINYVLLCKLYQTDFVIIHTKLVSGEGIEIVYKAYLSNFCFNSCFDLRVKEEICKFIVFLLGELKQDGKYTLPICLREYCIEVLR